MTRQPAGLARAAPPLVLVAGLVAAWEAYVRVSGISPLVLPAPSRIVEQLWIFRSDALGHLGPTLLEAVAGLAIAVGFAIAVALAMDRFSVLERALAPILVASQTIPVVAIAPLFVLWFGFGIAPKVLVVVLVTFFPIVVALLRGFAGVEADAMELLRSCGAGPGQTQRLLRWPAAMPSFFTGLRIGATYAVIGAVFGEYVGAREGLGIWMQLSQNAFRTDLVFGAILLTAVVSVALYLGVGLLERLAIPWHVASRAVGGRPAFTRRDALSAEAHNEGPSSRA
ncbi:MAG: ABC transporter permease [Chloroflexi bacterium]|nr:ABC transporter permease [Chloroflexota bacterium]